MNLVAANNEAYVFHLGRREKTLLTEVLGLYPRVPAGYQRLSRQGRGAEVENAQQLLDEALAEQRAENTRLVRRLLADPARLGPDPAGKGWLLRLSPSDFEWLLQVLNDIRVGSWVNLGCPEARLDLKFLAPANAPDFWAMEFSGYFQMQFLEALNHRA
ncbi:MAG TPA: hypothetical protein P5038_01065 [Candidatus Paceibacterota bacterium]|jgi:hypothetical protein|nr:hypothetical protein [Candidatus Paceibacterota bacterium]